MNRDDLMKGKPYDPAKHDVTDWWASEKIDGFRCVWDGQRLICGKVHVAAPGWFTEVLPGNMTLDGELAGGRGSFAVVGGLLRRKKLDEQAWRDHRITYRLFDAPGVPGGFETRIGVINSWLMTRNEPWVKLLPQWRVRDEEHVWQMLEAIEKMGGEGLMLRAPNSPYVGGRAHKYCLKVKSRHDAEAVVIGSIPGEGKHEGRMGALKVRSLSTGAEFKIGTGFDDAERENSDRIFPPGTVITFKYFELSKTGVPRFPSFHRVRLDP